MSSFTYKIGTMPTSHTISNIVDTNQEFVYGFICGIFNITDSDFVIHFPVNSVNSVNSVNRTTFYQYMSKYILTRIYDITNLPNPDKKYAWEIGKTIYQFNTMEFIQGFIYAGEVLEDDFRNYVMSYPYDKDYHYNISGYDLFFNDNRFDSIENANNIIPIMTRDRQDIIDLNDRE